MASEDPDDCRETFTEEENDVREEPVQFNESLWEKSSGKILREHVKQYTEKPDCKLDCKPDPKSIFGWFLICVICFDVGSDYLVTRKHFTKSYFDINVTDINDTSVTNIEYFVRNVTSRQCVLQTKITDSDDQPLYTFSCWQYDPWYGIFTFIFINLPATYILSSVLGPQTAGVCSVVWGTVMFFVGMILIFTGDVLENEAVQVVGWTVFILDLGMVFIGGVVHAGSRKKIESGNNNQKTSYMKNQWLIFMIYPILVLLSPLILLMIKIQSVLRANHEFIKKQAKQASLGESILESTPQYCLQLYIVLKTREASWSQIFSITTSALSLSLANLDKFLINNIEDGELGPNITTLKYFFIMFFISMFKVMSVSLMWVMFRFGAMFIMFGYCGVLYVCLLISARCHNLREEEDLFQQGFECFLSWLTVTNLENTRTAKIIRLVSTYSSIIFYSSILIIIAVIANVDPNILNGNDIPVWSEMTIVDDIYNLYILIGVTIGAGVMSLILDWSYWLIGWKTVFHGKRATLRYFD